MNILYGLRFFLLTVQVKCGIRKDSSYHSRYLMLTSSIKGTLALVVLVILID